MAHTWRDEFACKSGQSDDFLSAELSRDEIKIKNRYIYIKYNKTVHTHNANSHQLYQKYVVFIANAAEVKQ